MKSLLSTVGPLLALVLLCGCGGGYQTSTPGPPPLFRDIAGNWEFKTTSLAGMPVLTIAGNINQSGAAASGGMHVDGSTCFDPMTITDFTGTLTGSNISVTIPAMEQVISFTGNITDTGFTGTFRIDGGCADGDHGDLTGIKIPSITSQLNGTLTNSGGDTIDVTAQLTQGSASLGGSFELSGAVTFGKSCLSSGTIKPGNFPSGSFIIGTSVALEIETDNGMLAFRGTADQAAGVISGAYTIVGGTCNQTGTLIMLTAGNPWDY